MDVNTLKGVQDKVPVREQQAFVGGAEGRVKDDNEQWRKSTASILMLGQQFFVYWKFVIQSGTHHYTEKQLLTVE